MLLRRSSHARQSFLPETLEPRMLLAADPSPARDVVLTWNEILLDAVKVSLTPPPYAARNMAMVQGAVFDAVNGVYRDHKPYLVKTPAPKGASADAAAAAAAHRVLVNLYPAQREIFRQTLRQSLDAVEDGPGQKLGRAYGVSVGKAFLKARKGDGAKAVSIYVPGTDPHNWQPTPPAFAPAALPQWPMVKPFGIKRGDQFLPPAPPAITSEKYAVAFNEVKSLGAADSTARTDEQTQIAYFWADGAGTVTPPGHWNQIAADVARQQGNTLQENARLFALINFAMADAGIASWDCKYDFNLLRPITGIQNADQDGNDGTQADPDWQPLLTTPPFPAYISGHSTFSSAAATVLGRFYGTDKVRFTTTSDDLPGAARSFKGFKYAMKEAGMSRIYGGIHWNFDNTAGLATGRAIGEYVFSRVLIPRA